MDDCYWERLLQNLDGLKDVHPNDVTDYLYKDNVINQETAYSVTTIKDLLFILKTSSGFEVFESFLNALRNNGHETLANKIEATPITDDPKVKARGDPEAIKVLLRRFKVRKDSEIPLLEVREELEKANVFKAFSWKDSKIKDFLLEIFNGIEITSPQRKRKGGKKVRVVLVKNLCKVTDAEPREEETHASKEESVGAEPKIPDAQAGEVETHLTQEKLVIAEATDSNKEIMSGQSRPFRVWSCDRRLKKSLTVFSLEDLVKKGCRKLGFPNTADNVRVVLEEDGTEVDDEDYFSFVPANSSLILLRQGEVWQPVAAAAGAKQMVMRSQLRAEGASDETDHSSVSGRPDDDTAELASDLRDNLSRIITFSNDQLQQLVDEDTTTLAQYLGETERFARSLQEGCQRQLDDRNEAVEMAGLLRLYHRSRTAALQTGVKCKATNDII